jgi:hypothetical protein
MKLLKLTRKNGDPICILAGNGTRFGIHRQYDHCGREYAKDNAVWPVGCQEPEHVAETPDQIAAMLADPVAADSRHIPTMGHALVAIEPLAGAGVRTLPTPEGDKRFLCLPEVDMAKPASKGYYFAIQRHGRSTLWEVEDGENWNSPFEFPFNAAYGPLPEVTP